MKRVLILLLFTILFGCEESKVVNDNIESAAVIDIPLEGKASSRKSEISGLTWYKDKLILLPQYPHIFGENENGKIFSIDKKKLIDFVNNTDTKKIIPDEINFKAEGLERFNRWGSGYEAIAFKGDTVYLTIESFEASSTKGYLVSGIYNKLENSIVLNSSSLMQIPSQSKRENFSDETLIIWQNRVITLHELNNSRLVPKPVANNFDLGLKEYSKIPFPNIEFRITDATSVNVDGSFWVINYYYPGEKISGDISKDKIAESFGVQKFLREDRAVERLLKMRISENEIILAEIPPVYLEISEYPEGKNWEGIVKLDSLGFILATDKFPKTILAYVPFNVN